MDDFKKKAATKEGRNFCTPPYNRPLRNGTIRERLKRDLANEQERPLPPGAEAFKRRQAYFAAVKEICHAPMGECRDGTCLECKYASPAFTFFATAKVWDALVAGGNVRAYQLDNTEMRMFLLLCVEIEYVG